MVTQRSTIIFLVLAAMGGAALAQEIDPEFVTASEASFDRPHDLAPGPGGRYLYVADVGNDAIKVLDPATLAVVGAFGEDELDDPHDAAFGADGRLYVADTGNDRIAIYEVAGAEGRLVGQLTGGLASPEGVAPAPDGRVYVTNAGGNDIVLFVNGDLVKRAGRRGSGPDEFIRPHDVAVDPDGLVYVVDPGNDRISVLDPALAPVALLGGPFYGFDEPKYIDFDEGGRLYVADEDNHRVVILDAARNVVGQIGTGEAGMGAGVLRKPEGVAVGGGNIWISDTYNDRIVLYRLTNE